MSVLILFLLIHKLGKSSGQEYKRGYKAERAKAKDRAGDLCFGNNEGMARELCQCFLVKRGFESDAEGQVRRSRAKTPRSNGSVTVRLE